MHRLGGLVVALAAAAAWACSPAEFVPFTAKGETKRGLTLEVGARASVLKENGQVVWSRPVTAFEVLFAKDDSWVAFSPGLRSDALQIVPTARDAQPASVNLIGRLTKDERAFLTFSSCGLMWFSGWAATPQGLEVRVTQNGQARPTEAEAPGLKFLVAADGTITRKTPELVIDLAGVAAKWLGPASDARAETLNDLHRLAATETGKQQAAALGPFLRKVFATADARDFELDRAGRMVGLLPLAEQREVAELGLARPAAITGVLWGLEADDVRVPLATKVFEDRSKPGPARAIAVRVATRDGSKGYGPLLKAALTDPDPEVRDAAGDNVARAKCEGGLLADVLAVLRSEVAKPTVVEKNEYAHQRLSEHYHRTVWNCLRGGKNPDGMAEVAKAVQGGLRFEPSQSPAPDLYLALAMASERSEPNTVPQLLELAEQACAAQKYPRPESLVLVIQWRVLRAVAAKDRKTAAAQLARLDPKSTARVPALTTNDVGATAQFRGRYESVREFVARMKPFVK